MSFTPTVPDTGAKTASARESSPEIRARQAREERDQALATSRVTIVTTYESLHALAKTPSTLESVQDQISQIANAAEKAKEYMHNTSEESITTCKEALETISDLLSEPKESRPVSELLAQMITMDMFKSTIFLTMKLFKEFIVMDGIEGTNETRLVMLKLWKRFMIKNNQDSDRSCHLLVLVVLAFLFNFTSQGAAVQDGLTQTKMKNVLTTIGFESKSLEKLAMQYNDLWDSEDALESKAKSNFHVFLRGVRTGTKTKSKGGSTTSTKKKAQGTKRKWDDDLVKSLESAIGSKVFATELGRAMVPAIIKALTETVHKKGKPSNEDDSKSAEPVETTSDSAAAAPVGSASA